MNLFKRISSLLCYQSVLTDKCRQHTHFFAIRAPKFHSEIVFPKLPTERETGLSQDHSQNTFVQQKCKRNRQKRPLTTLFKHKEQNVITAPTQLAEVNCVPLAEEFDIDALCRDLDFTGFFTLNYINDSKIAVHCQRKLTKMPKFDDFFVFAEGVVVFWAVDRNSQNTIVSLLSKYQQNPFDAQLKNDEEETMAIEFTTGSSYASNDVMFLNSELHRNAALTPDGGSSELERFAFSHAMAASVKMGVWERTLELDNEVHLCIDGMKDSSFRWWNPLRRNGIPWTHKKALRMIGSFADLRHAVNSTDLLSKDVYWSVLPWPGESLFKINLRMDLPEVESVYGSLAKRLCLQSRRTLINERLGHCEYFSKTISDALNTEHSHLLEVIIILLIAFECAHVATNWLGIGHKRQQEQLLLTN